MFAFAGEIELKKIFFVYLLTPVSIVIFSGILRQTLMSEFEFHWVPYTSGLVSQLS